MDAVRDPLPLAVPPFHGNRMDVPRRLRPSRLLGFAQGQSENSFHGAGNPVAAADSGRNQLRAISDTARCYFLLRERTAGSGVPVLWIEIRTATVEVGRTPTARGVDSLSSVVVRTGRDTVQSGRNVIYVQTLPTSGRLFRWKRSRTGRSPVNESRYCSRRCLP